MIKILSTKKLDPEILTEAGKSGLEIVEEGFIEKMPVWNEQKWKDVMEVVERGIINFVFTSSTAVEIIEPYFHLLPAGATPLIFCIGRKTKQAVLNSTFPNIEICCEADSASALGKQIIETDVKELILFCGNKRRDELPGILNDAGIIFHEMVAYETNETPKTVQKGYDGILFFSPSAVSSFFTVNSPDAKTVFFAIGETTAQCLRHYSSNQVLISEKPLQSAMIRLVRYYFQNSTSTNDSIKK